jgi:hypothetical protein
MDDDWHDFMTRSRSSSNGSLPSDDEGEHLANIILATHIPSSHELGELKKNKVLKWLQEYDGKAIVFMCVLIAYWHSIQNLKDANVFKQHTIDLR